MKLHYEEEHGEIEEKDGRRGGGEKERKERKTKKECFTKTILNTFLLRRLFLTGQYCFELVKQTLTKGTSFQDCSDGTRQGEREREKERECNANSFCFFDFFF